MVADFHLDCTILVFKFSIFLTFLEVSKLLSTAV